MNSTKMFVYGMISGIALSMTISMVVFSYYIVGTIKVAKEEAQVLVESAREKFSEELQVEMKKIRESGVGFLEDTKGKVLENVKDRLKNPFGNDSEETDSTTTN